MADGLRYSKMIFIYYANRAESSILDPIKVELDRRNIENRYIDLSQSVSDIHLDKNLSKIYDVAFDQISELSPDLCVVIGDRREVMFATMAAFVQGVPIAQLASGDLSEEISLVDDYFRHIITIMSKKKVCFSQKSLKRSIKMLSEINLAENCEYFPNPTLSEFNFNNDSPTVSKSQDVYDLVLLHPQSLSREGTVKDKNAALSHIDPSKKTIVIRGNMDQNYDVLYDCWDSMSDLENITIIDHLGKNEFIFTLSNADRFITNSSCSYYEAPLFLNEEDIVRIGRRNRNREIVNYSMSELKSNKEIVDFLVAK